jgi:hypothetical protein
MSTGPPSVSRSRRHRWDGSPSQSRIRVLNRAEINTLFAKWRHAPAPAPGEQPRGAHRGRQRGSTQGVEDQER